MLDIQLLWSAYISFGLQGVFWPLTVSINLEVKCNHAHIKTSGILKKFSENIFVKMCMVWHDAGSIN